MDFISLSELHALVNVVVVDLVLAGDNAIVVGIAVAGLPARQRRRVMASGIAVATLLRIALASVTVQLLQIIGLLLAGGLLVRKTMRQAVTQIIVADVAVLLDNVPGHHLIYRRGSWACGRRAI